ncbi:MAG TPA: HAMP domain-containing methyl-accepting chemotaxis protein [Nitrospirota bacterium]|nr:HAMP domain-containing methyl-accepting chemotaxis protein [Nitrospirota bacterium]
MEITIYLREFFKRTVKDRIDANMGLKFMAATTGAIALVMILVTVLLTRMVLAYQYRTLEIRGRDIGTVLGKSIVDRLAASDLAALNAIVEDIVKSPELISVVIVNNDGRPLTSARSSFNRENAAVTAILDAAKTDDVNVLTEAIRRELGPLEVSVDVVLERKKLGQVRMAFSRSQIQASVWKIVMLLLGTSLLIIAILAALIYYMVRRMIVLPTRTAEVVASNIAAGDLTQSFRVSTMDEIGMLGRGLNRMIVGLKGMIENIREAAHKTDTVWREVKKTSTEITTGSKVQAESVEEAASSINEMHFSLKEIAGTVEALHKNSQQTASSVIEMSASVHEVAKTMADLSLSIEETSSAITQMSAAVRQIAENVEVLSTAAEDTAASATQISASVKEVETSAQESAALADAVAADAEQLGMRSIEKTIEGMNRIDATARRTAEVVNRLGERAESIGGILTVIEDITDQTGLLALNAAILAAQAGEHGKGFAVVAAEIRELANRTASSTKEIGALITSVQEDTRDAVGVMREEVTIVADGVLLARDAGEALKKILERADRARDMSKSINKATAEQTRGIRQVSDAVEKINEMTHQIARAANEQRAGSDQITRASEKMRELTRFVKNSTEEQAKGSKDITVSVEDMSTKIGMVHRAAGEVQAGSDLIVKAIERIKEIAKSNADLSVGLNIAMDVMAKQSETLEKDIEKFRT